jgi:membrane-bound serine protease (ClpP class)
MISTVIILVVFGLLLIAVEAFVPGGILGTFGVICILSAVAVTLFSEEFAAWSSGARTWTALGIIVFCGVIIALWLKLFAFKLFSRVFTLEASIASPPPPAPELAGAGGTALTELRPLGRVRLDDGSRHEARLLNTRAPAGSRIKVLGTEPGNLIVTLESNPTAT